MRLDSVNNIHDKRVDSVNDERIRIAETFWPVRANAYWSLLIKQCWSRLRIGSVQANESSIKIFVMRWQCTNFSLRSTKRSPHTALPGYGGCIK